MAYICPKITWRLIHLDNRGFIVVFPYRGEQPRQTIVGEEDQHKKQHDGDIHRNLLHLLHWKEYRRDLRDFASAWNASGETFKALFLFSADAGKVSKLRKIRGTSLVDGFNNKDKGERGFHIFLLFEDLGG